MAQVELALARQERLDSVASGASNRAVAAWRRGMGNDFDAAWARIVDQLTDVTAAAQVTAASGASKYVAQTAIADENDEPSGGNVQAGAFAGVDASGRDLNGLLYGAVTTAKTLIGGGSGLQGALLGGATYLATMVHTAVLDVGRSSDLTAMTARHYTHYVRVVSGGACSRCAILAGIASAKEAFLRHPRCRCTAAPVTDVGDVKGRYSNPSAYFESLSKAEQDRVFTNAGADAIRAGADPVAVVSARRGAVGIDYSRAVLDAKTLPNSGRRLVKSVIGRQADGTPILGYTTGEGTTARGAFGRQNRTATGLLRPARRIRVMPETIVGLTDDVTLRQVLLRDAGYLTTPVTATELRSPLGGSYVARRDELIREDRVIADLFYREHGITLG